MLGIVSRWLNLVPSKFLLPVSSLTGTGPPAPRSLPPPPCRPPSQSKLLSLSHWAFSFRRDATGRPLTPQKTAPFKLSPLDPSSFS